MKKLAVLTTGGDCPGLNAAIRAVVRSGIYYGYEMYGVPRGYDGLMSGNFIPMNSSSVSNIIQRGGTILKSARSEAFKTAEGRIKANEHLKQNGIDALVIIGGDGSLRGAQALEREHGVKIVGIPKTIDNDISGTDFAIGYDTALNTVVEAIDKIRDTADSHDRLFFVEVMGRDAGTIALLSGVASGAEAILIPETRTAIEQVVAILERGWQRKKSSCIVIVAEGDEEGGAVEVANKVKEKFNHYDTKICVLGHIQ
ncbi:MAG: 6-phosphofructokinase, partial [Bacteroidota bacterium]